MKPRFIAIIASILIIFGLINWYIGWNGWVYLSAIFQLEHAALYGIIVGIISVSYIIGRMLQASAVRPVGRFLKLIGSYWFAVVEYSVLLLPIADLIAWLLIQASVPEKTAVVSVGTVTIIVMAALLIKGTWNAWTPIVRTYNVSLPKQAGSLQKLRIGMASDLHLGTIVGKRHLQRLVDGMEKMKPDIILLPGDVIDDAIEPFIHGNMGSVMKNLHAPLGVYAVLGNHEYIGGSIPQFIAEMEAIGIRVLLDESVLIANSFYVMGRKDLSAGGRGRTGRLPISEMVASVDTALPLIMMDHQPSDLGAAADNGIDISLSGHTHRGQMAPNHLITRRLFELDWGFLKKGNLHAIVSSGFGTWGPPIRIGSRSEIIQINVEFGQ